MASIISSLQLVGLCSGCYLGYRYGDSVKKLCCDRFPVVEKYRKMYVADKFKKSQVSEEIMFKMIGGMVGVLGGYNLWFIGIPVMVFQLIEDNPNEYKKMKEYFTKLRSR